MVIVVRQIRNEWKVHFTWLYLIPTALLAIFLYYLNKEVYNPFVELTMRDLYAIFELIWPLSAVLGISTILPQEHEEGMLELRLSYPKPYRYSVIRKIALPYSWWFVVGISAMLWCSRTCLSFNMSHMLGVVFPPTVFLSGITLLLSSLTLDPVVSILITLIYWVFEWMTAGARSGNMALFPFYAGLTSQIDIAKNRVLLVSIGILLKTLALIVIRKRKIDHTSE